MFLLSSMMISRHYRSNNCKIVGVRLYRKTMELRAMIQFVVELVSYISNKISDRYNPFNRNLPLLQVSLLLETFHRYFHFQVAIYLVDRPHFDQTAGSQIYPYNEPSRA